MSKDLFENKLVLTSLLIVFSLLLVISGYYMVSNNEIDNISNIMVEVDEHTYDINENPKIFAEDNETIDFIYHNESVRDVIEIESHNDRITISDGVVKYENSYCNSSYMTNHKGYNIPYTENVTSQEFTLSYDNQTTQFEVSCPYIPST